MKRTVSGDYNSERYFPLGCISRYPGQMTSAQLCLCTRSYIRNRCHPNLPVKSGGTNHLIRGGARRDTDAKAMPRRIAIVGHRVDVMTHEPSHSDVGVASESLCLAYQTHQMNRMTTIEECPVPTTPFWFKSASASDSCESPRDGRRSIVRFAKQRVREGPHCAGSIRLLKFPIERLRLTRTRLTCNCKRVILRHGR